jgi:ferredoxin-NADP reductase
LQIAVLKDPQSRGGSVWLHDKLAEGDVLQIRGPRNHFRFDDTAKRAVFVAGGIGVTPVMTMARQAWQLGMDYVFHYSARSREHMAFVDELQALHGHRLQLHLSSEDTRADYAAMLAACEAGTQVYACGPQALLQVIESACDGVQGVTLKLEYFQAKAAALDPAKEQAFEIELKDSGLLLTVAADRTVMETLRAANIDVQSDCGEGLCGSCEVRVLDGMVDHRDLVLTAAERVQQDKMMVCCSRSAGGRLVLEL